MKVAFVCAEDEIPGLCYLSSHLKNHGHQVELIFEPKQFSRAYLRHDFLAQVFSREKSNLEKISQIKPDLIGFSCTTAHYQWALGFARKVKKRFPKIPIIFGGVHPTLLPELVLKEKSIDFVCIGEGEAPLLELIQAFEKDEKDFKVKNIWYKKGKKIIKRPLRPLLKDLDELPYLDKRLFRDYLPEHYFSHIYFFTGRGCPYNCSFCGNEQMRKIFHGLGKYVRRMSPERAIEELIILKEKHGAKYILFEDDIFAMDPVWLKKFIPLYRKKIGLPFTCFGHAQVFNLELVKLLKKGGCDLLWFGVQSANEKIRKEVFNRYETNEQIKKAAKLCRRVGIGFMVDHILNVPHDTEAAIKEAVQLYNEIQPGMINCYNLLYFPKAKINDLALKAGLIKKKDIGLINQGKFIVYQTGELIARKRNFYNRYALLLTSIPLLPQWLVTKINKNDKAIEFFGRLPLFLVPMVKIFLNFRIGRGFLPLAILKMEWFFTKKFLGRKLKGYFKTASIAFCCSGSAK